MTSTFLRGINTKNSLKIGYITTLDYSVKLTKQTGPWAEPTKGHFAASIFDAQNTCQEAAGWSPGLQPFRELFSTFFFFLIKTVELGGICSWDQLFRSPHELLQEAYGSVRALNTS